MLYQLQDPCPTSAPRRTSSSHPISIRPELQRFGPVLSELIGASSFHEKVEGLARSNLVQQGGELAYLIRHDPEFRGVRREHLEETGRRVRLRSHIPALVEFLERGIDGHRFSFFVISAAPKEVIAVGARQASCRPTTSSAPSSNTRPARARCDRFVRVPAGYGKVAVVEELERPARDRAGPHDLRRRRQLGRARHAAREQP